MLLTNQGDLVNKIMRAGNYHEKEYLVTVDKPVDGDFVKKNVIWNSYSGYHYPSVFCEKNREKFLFGLFSP